MEDESTEQKPRQKNKLVQASLKNVLQQRQLVLELQEIDKQMEVEMKSINKEKLEAIRDICRLDYDKRTAEYLRDDLVGRDLKRYNQHRRDIDGSRKDEKENKEKFDFKIQTTKIYVKLPALEIPELLKESNPPVPPKKPRLYRSNSLFRARSMSENSLVLPVPFSTSLRRSETTLSQYTSLPDINKFDKNNRKMAPLREMPDIAEHSEPPKSAFKGVLPELGDKSLTFC